MFNKRVLKKAVDELNKAKKPAKQKDIIVDPKGQWAHPGQVTRIPSNKITMQGVGYPVLGVPNKGQPKMMMPGQYFEFPEADYVDEYPQMQDGGQIYTYAKRPGSYYKKDSKGSWMIKNESTHGKYVAIDDPKGTRSKALNAQAKPLQKAPKVEETLVTKVKTIPKDNTFYDSTLQPGESTAVRNLIEKPIPDVIGKDTMTYLKEQKEKKEKAINKYIRAKNKKVKEFYKEYHESPRYNEMLSKSSPDKYEDYAAGRMINLEGYNDFNMSKPHLYIRHKQPKDDPGTGGFSLTDSGDITVLPKGFGVKGLLPHEWSHSTDRPIFLGINPFTGKNFKVSLNDRLIPKKDEQWITKNRAKTWFDSPKFMRQDPEVRKWDWQHKDDPYIQEYVKNQEKWYDYVGEPTETRARLNDIRFQSKQKEIYDPFTEKVTPATLKKLLKTKFESGDKEGFDPLQQLRELYTDEEIQWMLNNISKNQQAEEEGAQSFGRYGGQFQEGGESGCKPGYYWNGKECVKSFIPVAKETPKPLVKNKKEQELIDYGKKTLPNKKSVDRSVKNIPFYGDISNAAQPDDLQENIAEFIDPTGVVSWDDAYRAKAAWDKSGSEYPNANQALDMFGAVPGLGKLGKLKYLKNASAIKNSMKYVAPAFGVIPWQSILNAFDTGQDVNQDNIKYQDGGEQGCPEGYAFNPKTGECIEWNPDIRESYDQPTSFDPVGDVIYMNPDDRPEGMSDEEYAQMYNDQVEHEQLHRLQWKNDELKGESKTPLRMPSTVDNQEYEGAHYYNRRGEEEAYLHDMWNEANPDLRRFIPEDVVYDKEINPVMYELPWTEEGEARGYEGALHSGMESFFPKKQDGGEKDKWGRPKDSKWYGFDPKTKKYTTKDNWGRSPEDKWYGFNPDNKSWSLTNQGNKTNKTPAPKEYKLEEDIVDPLLGSPQKKGAKFANGVDNLRHSMSSYYTAKGLQPYLGAPASIVGANVLGAAHEVKRIFDDPDDWSTKLRTSGEDMFNNAVGSAMSILPESWAKGSLKYLSDNNLLPDGVDYEGRDLYVKETGGVPQYAPGGSTGCPPGSYWNGKDCVKLPKGAKVITDPKEYARRKGAYEDSLVLYNLTKDDIANLKNLEKRYANSKDKASKKLFAKEWFNYAENWYDEKGPKLSAVYNRLARINKKAPKGKEYASKLDPNQAALEYKKPKQPVVFGKKELGDDDPSKKVWNKKYKRHLTEAEQKWLDDKFKLSKQVIDSAKRGDRALYEKTKNEYQKKYNDSFTCPNGQCEIPDDVNKKSVVRPVVKKQEPVIKEEPVKQDVVIDKLPIKPAYIDRPKKDIIDNSNPVPPKISVKTEPEYTPEYSEEGGPDSVGYHYKDRQKRYIDWNGRAVGYRPLKFRKPGHSGDLVKLGGKKYFYLPTIESRTEGWFEADNDNEEEYQDGGQYKTKLTPEEEFDFQSFFRTLPDNLQTDDDTYDIRGYWDSEGRPGAFNYDQPKEDDGYYHAYSINQNTGEYLKSPAHDTFQHAVDEDRKIGYRPITNIQGRNIAVENQSIADPEEQSYLRNMEGPANYIELDLTPEEIQEYAKGGYIIEDISVPSLTKAQKGGIFGRRKRRKEQEAQQQQPQYVAPVEVDDELYESVTPYAGAPQDFKQGVGNIKEVGVAAKAPEWLKFSREYEDKNSRQAFIDKKKRDYLKNTNKGLAKAAGLNMENFPEQVERNFANEYDYKKNSYVMKKLSKTKGFSLNRRGEWVDQLTKPEKQILADSKYESKLQPSIWARTNAGIRTLYDQIKGKQYSNLGRRETYEGMTEAESKAIQDQGLLGALNTFAIAEAPGYGIANLINRTGNLSYGSNYREMPNPFEEGELMSGVNQGQAALVNPVNYVLPYELMTLGAAGAAGLRNLFTKPATEGVVGEFATVKPALTAGAEEATVAGINRPRRLMDVVETDPNAYRQVARGTIKPETRLLPEATNRDLVIPDDANFGNPPYPDELYDEIYATEPSLNYGEPRPWENTFSGLTADELDYYDYITQAYKDKAMNELNAGNITRRDIAAPTDQFNVPPPETYYQPFDPNVAQQEIDELRRIYHTAERNLTPEEARALSQEGVGSQSDYMPENFGEDFDATDIGEYETRADANNALIEKKDKLAKIDDHISWLDDEYKSLNLDQYSTAADIPEPIAKRATEIELEITRLTDQRNAKINPPAPAQRTPAFRIVNGQVISEELAFAKDVLQQQLGLPANADMPGMIQAVNRMDMTDPVRVDFEQALIGEGLDPNDIYAEARPSSTTVRHQLPVDRTDEIAENPFAGLRGEKSKSTAEISSFVAAQIDRTIVPGTNRSIADVLGSHTNPLDAVRDVRSFVQDGLMSEFSGRDVMEALREEIRKMPVTGDEKKFLIKEAKRISNAPKSQAYTGSNVTEDEAARYALSMTQQEREAIRQQYGYTHQDIENAARRWQNNSVVYDAVVNQLYDDYRYMREHNMLNPNPRVFNFRTGEPSPLLMKKGELGNLPIPKKDMDLIKKTKYDMSTRNTSGTIGYSDVDDPTVYTITDMNMIPKTEDLDDLISAYEKAYKEATGGLKDELEAQLEDLRSTKWLRTEYAKELKAEGLNPTEIEKVTVISNSSNQKNLIKGNGEVIGTLNVGKGKLSTGEPGVKIGSSGVALRFHPYRVGSKHSKYKTWEGAQQALEKRIFDKEIATISNPADRSNPIVIKSLKKKAKTEADKVIDRLKENNNNNYGEALYRGIHNGTKETRGSLFTRQSFAPTSLEDPVTGLPDFRKRAENFWGSQQRQINELGIPKAELLPVPEAFKNDQWYTPDIVMRRKLGGNTNKLNKFIR